MDKKLITACMAITAAIMVFGAPTAPASPVLTTAVFGKTLPVGASIVGKNTSNMEFTGGFNVVCSTATMQGTLTSNSGTQVKGEIPVGSAKFTGTGTSGDCTSALGSVSMTVNSKLCLETVKGWDSVSITGCAGNVTFSLNVTGLATCRYSTASVLGFFWTSSQATIGVENQKVSEEEPRSFFCPDEGTWAWTFSFYTTNGEPVNFS